MIAYRKCSFNSAGASKSSKESMSSISNLRVQPVSKIAVSPRCAVLTAGLWVHQILPTWCSLTKITRILDWSEHIATEQPFPKNPFRRRPQTKELLIRPARRFEKSLVFFQSDLELFRWKPAIWTFQSTVLNIRFITNVRLSRLSLLRGRESMPGSRSRWTSWPDCQSPLSWSSQRSIPSGPREDLTRFCDEYTLSFALCWSSLLSNRAWYILP